MLERETRNRLHSYRTILFGAKRGIPRECDEFGTADFLTRTVALDAEIERIWQRYYGPVDTLGAFLPEESRAHARRGGPTAEIF